ncbi:hypothetical protein N0V90_011528 [Kalmusia sp. IMI 367209]|nr:hypothetical protein N0V90_011528 [Kalmusia sp. IMI 367209]
MSVPKGDQLQPSTAVVAAPDPAHQVRIIEEAAVAEKNNSAGEVEGNGVGGLSTKKNNQATFGNYFRVYTYGTKLDALLLVLCVLASIGSGIAMPLMNIVFGQLVGHFADYFLPDTTVTKQEFQSESLAFTIGLYVVAFIKGPILTLIASISLPFIFVTYGLLLPPMMKFHKAVEETLEEASAVAYEIFSSIRIVAAFGAQAKLSRQHEVLLDKARDRGKKVAPWMGMIMAPSMMAMYGELRE